MQFHIPYELYKDRYPTKSAALYHALRDSMVKGTLPVRTRLPSTRTLAGMYGLSRGTVNQVYEMLASEGYLFCETGRGTYTAYDAGLSIGTKRDEPQFRLSAWAARLGAAGNAVAAMEGPDAADAPAPPDVRRHDSGDRQGGQEANYGVPLSSETTSREGSIPLHNGMPRMVDFGAGWADFRSFPHAEWNRLLYAQVRELGSAPPDELMTAQGYLPLRESIARYLRRSRGIAVQPEQIAIVGGSMQAIALLAQLLLNPGDAAVTERPGFAGIRRAVLAAGGRPIRAEVDDAGIVPAAWDARLLFVTPARQFPTGAVLSLERRLALLRWAAEREAVIVEDDYDSEFRHRGRSLEPFKALDGDGRVIYVGSFTKTLPPAFRIGYAVLPHGLISPFAQAQALYEPYPVNPLEQRALAAFMAAGSYERHLRRMKRLYSRKFDALRRLLHGELSGLFEWVESDAGLHLFGWWKHSERRYTSYKQACAEAGVRWSETEPAARTDGRRRIGAYFHFAALTEEDMALGVERMSACMGRAEGGE